MKNNPRYFTTTVVFLAAMLMVLSAAATSKAQSSVARIDGFIKHTGYEFVSPTEKVWGIKRPSGMVIVAVDGDVVIVGMVVTTKAKFKLTAESAGDMLMLAHHLDFLKIGLDDDGDLFVRAEEKIGSMTQADFDDILKRVVKGSDDASAKIRPYLIK